MARFNTTQTRPTGRSAIATSEVADGTTFEGGRGFTRDARGELFLSAATSFTDNTFYETESDRLARQRALARSVAVGDPEWMISFLTWLRSDARIRTASLILAAEAVKGRIDAKVDDTPKPWTVVGLGNDKSFSPRGYSRRMVDVVLQRPDEPGELLAYWTSRYGKALPKPIKRGIADAAIRLYSERSLLKYDGQAKGYRFADVLDLTHPLAKNENQALLFEHALARRHNRDKQYLDGLPVLQANAALRQWSADDIVHMARNGELATVLNDAGMTWEAVPSLVNGAWTKELWEAIIPSMGVMALVRNLRNFDAVGVGAEAFAQVSAKLDDPAEIERSRILPMRLLAAYRAAPNVRWAAPLEAALQHSLANIPALDGDTLILVDRSGSMFGRVSSRSDLNYADTAAVFGTALALRANQATLIEYGSTAQEVKLPKGSSVLPTISKFHDLGGTYTAQAVKQFLTPRHTRVVILTDEQSAGYWGGDPGDVVPKTMPMHVFNLVGYRHGGSAGGPNRYAISGLSDASWPLIQLNESGASGKWPWEINIR